MRNTRIIPLLSILSIAIVAFGCANSNPVVNPTIGPPASPSSSPSSTTDPALTAVPTTTNVAGKTVKLKSKDDGLEYYDVVIGKGATVQIGHTVSASYTGSLLNGTVFDSTAEHGGKPLDLVVGENQVIKGWDEGLVGMKVGGERILVIPSYLGYGSTATGSIPANATLVFDIKIVSAN
jgi:FKBP-type peptidyl-prolyl cis-trans isomerase